MKILTALLITGCQMLYLPVIRSELGSGADRGGDRASTSAFGYNRKFWAVSDYVRSSPKTGHPRWNVCFSTENVRLALNSGRK